MIVDLRTLLDNLYAKARGAPDQAFEDYNTDDESDDDYSGEGKFDTCLRVSVGTPNVGVGDLWVTAPSQSFNSVTQHRFNRNSGITDTPIPGSFTQDGHPHLHFKNWSQIRLRKIDSSCPDPMNATKCPVVSTGTKGSFCLEETVPAFDTNATGVVYQPNRTYPYCINDGVTISQGIGSGRADCTPKTSPVKWSEPTGYTASSGWKWRSIHRTRTAYGP